MLYVHWLVQAQELTLSRASPSAGHQTWWIPNPDDKLWMLENLFFLLFVIHMYKLICYLSYIYLVGVVMFCPCFFVQVTILKLVWRSRRADAPRCAHFSTDICSVIQEGEMTVEKCLHWGAPARRERHMLSLGQNKHGHNHSAPSCHFTW